MHHFSQRGAPRQALQSRALLSRETSALAHLQAFLRQRRAAREPVQEVDAFAQEWHRLFGPAERAALGHAWARFALAGPAIEGDGERDHRVLRCATTDTSAAGPVRVERRR